jgi:hypothetical protein
MSDKKLSILSNASTLDVRTEPYPHIVIKNALDPEIYQQLADEYPDPAVVLNGREKKDTWYDYPACEAISNEVITPLWKEFLEYHTSQAFYQDLINLFGDVIQQVHPSLSERYSKPLAEFTTSIRETGAAKNPVNHQSDVSLECQFYVNYTEQARAVRGPHVDRPTELYAALLYFRDPADDSSGSDLQVCAANDPKQLYPNDHQIKVDHLPMEVEEQKISVVDTAKYEANTLVLFINSKKSIHAVSPRNATPIARRHINFTADLFGLKDDALFEVKHKPDKKLKMWLESQPVIWRLAKLLKD